MKIRKRYEPRYHGRLKWMSKRDRGIYDAMNKGISGATGEEVGILNSDDFYYNSGVFGHIATAFEDDPKLMCVCGNLMIVDADASIGMGVTVSENAIVGVRSAVFKDVAANTIIGRNPAKFIKKRFES